MYHNATLWRDVFIVDLSNPSIWHFPKNVHLEVIYNFFFGIFELPLLLYFGTVIK